MKKNLPLYSFVWIYIYILLTVSFIHFFWSSFCVFLEHIYNSIYQKQLLRFCTGVCMCVDVFGGNPGQIFCLSINLDVTNHTANHRLLRTVTRVCGVLSQPIKGLGWLCDVPSVTAHPNVWIWFRCRNCHNQSLDFKRLWRHSLPNQSWTGIVWRHNLPSHSQGWNSVWYHSLTANRKVFWATCQPSQSLQSSHTCLMYPNK